MSANNKRIIYQHIWCSIHILAKACRKDQQSFEAYVCLIQCLGVLIPDHAYRQNINSFMEQSKITEYLPSRLFEWSYKFHSFINTIRARQGREVEYMSFEDVQEQYATVTKTHWGNSVWCMIHFLFANLPYVLTDTYKIAIKSFLVSLQRLIPCEECSSHMLQYMKEHSIIPCLQNGPEIFVWSVKFHNDVNKRLGKSMLNISIASALYKRSTHQRQTNFAFIDVDED